MEITTLQLKRTAPDRAAPVVDRPAPVHGQAASRDHAFPTHVVACQATRHWIRTIGHSTVPDNPPSPYLPGVSATGALQLRAAVALPFFRCRQDQHRLADECTMRGPAHRAPTSRPLRGPALPSTPGRYAGPLRVPFGCNASSAMIPADGARCAGTGDDEGIGRIQSMSIIAWLVVGAIAGWLAGMLVKGDEGLGVIGHIVLGIVGALVGGFLAGLLLPGNGDYTTGINFTTIITAVIGA